MTTTIHGTCDPRFSAVRDAFANNFASGSEHGACVAISVGGEMVVDLWGGCRDEAKTQPWEENTIVNVYSTTKTMTALTALMLADRGQLDLHAPVAKYWPEFAANGKENVTVAHLMSHAAGLPGWDEMLRVEDIYDWNKACALLAAQKPWWEPGTASGYHAVTQGYLVGEVVRRVTGKSLGTVFREEIAEPLNADFHIGTGAEHDPRIAELIPPTPSGGAAGPANDPASIAGRTFASPPLNAYDSRTRAWRAAEIPAAGGHGNARSVCEVQTVLANGGVSKGKRIMSADGCRVALQEQVSGTDLVFGAPQRFGMGYGLPGALMRPIHPDATCYWGGWGGSIVMIDMDARFCFAYVMNRMANTTVGDMRAFTMLMPAFQAVA